MKKTRKKSGTSCDNCTPHTEWDGSPGQTIQPRQRLQERQAYSEPKCWSIELNATKLENLMIEHGLIQPAAIDDSQGYDNGDTKSRIAAVYREIYEQFILSNA